LQFWRLARPTRIDDSGVETYFLGRPLRKLAWVEMRGITKLRYRHPMGYYGELVWLRGGDVPGPSNHAGEPPKIPLRATINPWRRPLVFFLGQEIWVTSDMGSKSFRTACELITHYARLHGIPMEAQDSRPDTLRKFKETASREAYREARRRGVVSPIDQL